MIKNVNMLQRKKTQRTQKDSSRIWNKAGNGGISWKEKKGEKKAQKKKEGVDWKKEMEKLTLIVSKCFTKFFQQTEFYKKIF